MAQIYLSWGKRIADDKVNLFFSHAEQMRSLKGTTITMGNIASDLEPIRTLFVSAPLLRD